MTEERAYEYMIDELRKQFEGITDNHLQKYRSVFMTADGQWVLTDLLNSMQYFGNFYTSGLEAMFHNFGNLILAKCGANHPEHVRHGFIVRALIKRRRIAALLKMVPLSMGREEYPEEIAAVKRREKTNV